MRVTDEHMLISELLGVAKAHSDMMPTEKIVVHLTIGQMSMIAKGLELLAAVRAATK